MSLIPQSWKKSIALWMLNYALSKVLSNPNVQEKQKQLVMLINTILDATRDFKLTEEEISSIKTRFEQLFSK